MFIFKWRFRCRNCRCYLKLPNIFILRTLGWAPVYGIDLAPLVCNFLHSTNLKFWPFMFSGSTYGTFRRELEREVVTLIPFTCVDTFRGHLEKVNVMLVILLIVRKQGQVGICFKSRSCDHEATAAPTLKHFVSQIRKTTIDACNCYLCVISFLFNLLLFTASKLYYLVVYHVINLTKRSPSNL